MEDANEGLATRCNVLVFIRITLCEHDPEIRWEIENNLKTRLSLKLFHKMYFWKPMQKPSIDK